jgi:DNA-binding SARP family transcriptional activator/predicted ATPase
VLVLNEKTAIFSWTLCYIGIDTVNSMLKINLLGRTSSNLNGSPTLAFRTRKAEAILYYLVMAAQPIDRSTIAELFWSDMTTANAQKNLRSVLPGLRDLLGDYLLITNRQITFNQSLEHLVDLYELQRVLADSSLTHAEKFSQFTKYYQGELLAGLSIANAPEFESWLAQQREALQQTITIALQHWTEHFLEQKNFKLGLEATHIWLKMQPWSEIAHGLRMQLFWRSKQRSAALLQYNQCCTYLEDELGVEPSAGIKALYIQIQKDSVPLASESQEKEASQPAPRPKAPTHNLPRRIMSYVGRTAEIETLLDYLLEKNHPLISIVGEGGIGKTSLALTVAERLAAKIEATPYSDGIWLISCAGVDAGFSAQEQLVISIATTIGMQFQGTNPFLEQLTDYLANKSMLLIIDNFEHLAEHITLLWSWVQQTKTVQFLITSRHNLNLQSNLPLYLTGLEIPPFAQNNLSFLLSADDLAHLQSFPIVQLLQERATKAWPNFVVNQQNGVAVAKLCHLLDGNPLALELAATLLINYDIATIYTELLDNYTLLAAELNELPLRQRSIHNTIDYTWQMLSPELATLMAQCSSFRGIFTCQAVTAITGQSIQKVNQLTQRSMLYMDTQRNLHIHSMMQQFAAQKLQENAAIAQATKQKHSEYFIGLLSTWWENSESQHIVAKLLPHLDNIYAAWDWAFNHQSFGLLSRSIIPFTQFHIYAGLLWDVQLLIQSYQQKLEEQRAILPEISPKSPQKSPRKSSPTNISRCKPR